MCVFNEKEMLFFESVFKTYSSRHAPLLFFCLFIYLISISIFFVMHFFLNFRVCVCVCVCVLFWENRVRKQNKEKNEFKKK